MFGWLFRNSFLETSDKTWVEWRMRWLIDQFGLQQLKSVRVIEPTAELFPETWLASPDQVHDLFRRVCQWMSASTNTVELRIILDSELDALGTYSLEGDVGVICIASSQLTDLETLIATMAHEVAHHRLLGESRLSVDEGDHEWVTDLLPLYFGLGIFAANNVLRETHSRAGNESWSTLSRRGYLPARKFGYAFALFAHLRHETNPTWRRHLRLDAADVMRKGLRFLSRGEKTILDFPLADSRSLAVLSDQLRSSVLSHRLAALWEVETLGSEAASLVPLVVENLTNKDRALRVQATRALAAIGDEAKSVALAIVPCLGDTDSDVRTNAAMALAQLHPESIHVVPELCELLADDSIEVVISAASALETYMPDAHLNLKLVLLSYVRNRNNCSFEALDPLAAVLAAIPNLPERVRETFREWPETECDDLSSDILERAESLRASEDTH